MNRTLRASLQITVIAGLALLGVIAGTIAVHAAPVSPSDLFLSPSSIVDDHYDGHVLASGSGWDYTDLEVGGTLQAVRILPLLVPNPNRPQGEYTDSDLVGINVSNYTSYFSALPDVDYAVDLTPSLARVDYGRPGAYLVEIIAEDQGVQFTKLYYDEVDDALGQNPNLNVPRDRVGVARQMTPMGAPMSEYIVVSNQALEGRAANGYSAGALATLQSQGKNVVTADSLNDAIMKIMAESQRLGRPIAVDLVGHGTPGTIQIGNAILAARNGAMTPQQFGAALNGKVSNLNFYSCNTGQGLAGRTMANDITTAAMIPSIGAFNTYTSAWSPRPEFQPVFQVIQTPRGPVRIVNWVPTGRTIPGGFDVGGRGIRGTLVPEPASLTLAVSCLGVVLAIRRRTRHSPANTRSAAGRIS